MFASRFFRRVFLPYLALICAATAAVGFFAALRLRSSYLENTRQSLHDQAQLVEQLVQGDLARRDSATVQAHVSRIGSVVGCRVTLVGEDGVVIADNEADPATMENHRGRPEIVEAAARGEGSSVRYSHTVSRDFLYLARRAEAPGGKVYFVRLSVHLADLARQLNVLYGALATIALAAMVVAGIIGFYFARRQTAPVQELAAFADAVAKGDLRRRILTSNDGELGILTTSLNTMADSLGRLLSQSEKDRAELLAILASMSEGVIAIDTRQRIVVVNRRAAELLGFLPDAPSNGSPPRESLDGAPDARSNGSPVPSIASSSDDPALLVHGKPLWEVVRNEEILKATNDVLAGGERRAFQVSPSTGRYLEVTAATFPRNGPPAGLVLVAHDTTQSVRYQELRKEFVANVSHELRTPLTVIKGFTETLRDGAMNDPVKGPKFLGTIERHVDQLTNLVNDLLELSRLESSPDLPRRVNFDPALLVRRACDLLIPAAQKKSQTLTVRISGSLPRLVGNADYVERAIANLVDNAIKYTPEHGTINVVASADLTSVTVEVTDNGIGIPGTDLARVFERFYRVDRSRSRDMGGTGLGLSIVKHVAQAHAGSIEVASTPGAGSRFRLKLPIPQS